MNDIVPIIKQALYTIETQEQVRILYACESGSRAWGFASHDSDYDIRFLYVRPQHTYLRLDLPRDVIERPIVNDLDINGWDIFKALRLMRKFNPPLLEWLLSPIVYQESSPTIEELRAIARRYFSPNALYYHYNHMVDGNYRQYLKDKSEVILKKYLYALRPLIAIQFLEQQHQLPPTNFLDTLKQVQLPDEIRARIHTLVARKMATDELGLGEPDTLLNTFIEAYLDKWQKQPFDVYNKEEMQNELEDVLQRILEEN